MHHGQNDDAARWRVSARDRHAGCQGSGGPVDLSSRRERQGGSITSASPGPLITDPSGATTRRERIGGPLAPGGVGAIGTGTPSSAAARAVDRTPAVFDDNRGAPL
ncbi:hypothetical protein D9599_07200 [Roseomonas sp. KE2513]|uniref:hypothetical protein n=1 Tax=Roseomonas sp. KE2513 TaxID=2479202 RepID=UPI0018DFB950|nr:hypothetical protein [Roseomonas sp. KE2513]MBI0535353.1 hypothetical protein [Roseomonas sp. KE2513]